jgi:hypothetical protein
MDIQGASMFAGFIRLALGAIAATASCCAMALSQQYWAGVDVLAPTSLTFADPSYTANGQFEVRVEEWVDCSAGTYTLTAVPVAGSGPTGSTPPTTSPGSFADEAAGGFLFLGAGAGRYVVDVVQTAGPCAAPTNPVVVDVVVPESSAAFTVRTIAQPSTEAYGAPGYIDDGELYVTVADGTCAGSYSIGVTPVPGSGPGGTTPPDPPGDYAGVPAGTFLFVGVGPGRYSVSVADTSACVMPSKSTTLVAAVPGVAAAPPPPVEPAVPVPVDDSLAIVLVAGLLAGTAARRLSRR